jgi:hypothetical protein
LFPPQTGVIVDGPSYRQRDHDVNVLYRLM